MPMPAVDSTTKQQGKNWLLPPYSYSLRRIATELNVGITTVHKWRNELVDDGQLSDDAIVNSDYSAEQKFAAVIATSQMSELELSGYCREHGLFVEQVRQWKAISIAAHEFNEQNQHKLDVEQRASRKKIKSLEKALERKDKALAETAALLVLREKFNALWGNSEED